MNACAVESLRGSEEAIAVLVDFRGVAGRALRGSALSEGAEMNCVFVIAKPST